MTENEMLCFVKNTFPDLTINEVHANDRGWDNDILIVNKKIVFRFPKSSDILSKILDERKILELLKLKNPILRIPDYEFVYSGSELKGVKYSFLEGSSLSEIPINNLKNNPLNAKAIGDFLTKLHSIDVSKLNETNLGTTHTLKYWEGLYSKVKSDIFPFLNIHQQNDVNAVFSDFIDGFTKLTFNKTIIHGDLTASNIIYNKKKGNVSGIIDFTDAQIGDPAFDFAGLYWDFGPDFTEDVLHWYRGNETTDSILSRVKTFYGLQPIFHELLYAVKNNEEVNWNFAFEKFTALYALSK